jgi:hypothetical protein
MTIPITEAETILAAQKELERLQSEGAAAYISFLVQLQYYD